MCSEPPDLPIVQTPRLKLETSPGPNQ
jgi:hypothetical protein